MDSSFLEDPKISRFEEYLEPKFKVCCLVPAYRCYFNIDSDTVRSRILKSLGIIKSNSFFGESVPDLYGPVWISTTLIMLMFYIKSIDKVSIGSLFIITGTIYSVLLVVPFISYCILKHVSIVYMTSLYGYSLIGYLIIIPASSMVPGYYKALFVFLMSLWVIFTLAGNLIKELDADKKTIVKLIGLITVNYIILGCVIIYLLYP
jgi:small neutral amino acid transporter SnatA (MarC family)